MASNAAYSEPIQSFEIQRQPISSVCGLLTKTTGVKHTCSRELETQPLSATIRDATGTDLRRWVVELLSVDNQARVAWEKEAGGGFRLAQNSQRRQLVDQRLSAEDETFESLRRSRITWLEGEGKTALEEYLAADSQKALSPNPVLRDAVFLKSLDRAAWQGFLNGAPIVFSTSNTTGNTRAFLDRYLRFRVGAQAVPNQTDRRCCVWTIARAPGRAGGRHVIENVMTSPGESFSRTAVLVEPRKSFGAAVFTKKPLTFPRVDANDMSRRIDVTFYASNDPKDDSRKLFTFDELLAVMGKQCNLNILSDGYLRPAALVARNYKLEKYPLKQAFDALGSLWDFDWRFADANEGTILIRAKAWWLEDRDNVSDALVSEAKKTVSGVLDPRQLAILAEMSPQQLHKLSESGVLPNAAGLVNFAFYDDTGARPMLRLFLRMTEAQQARANSQRGVPLISLDSSVVHSLLDGTLLTYFGSADSRTLAQVSLSVVPSQRNTLFVGLVWAPLGEPFISSELGIPREATKTPG